MGPIAVGSDDGRHGRWRQPPDEILADQIAALEPYQGTTYESRLRRVSQLTRPLTTLPGADAGLALNGQAT